MKNIIIAAIIIITAGLIGFYIVKKQPEQIAGNPKLRTETNYAEPGQNANLRQAILKIDGMFCASCATGSEYALKEKAGVIDASVDYDSETGRVVYDPSKISKDEIIQAVKPYTAVITEDAPLN